MLLQRAVTREQAWWSSGVVSGESQRQQTQRAKVHVCHSLLSLHRILVLGTANPHRIEGEINETLCLDGSLRSLESGVHLSAR